MAGNFDYSLIGNYPFVTPARAFFSENKVEFDETLLRKAASRVTGFFSVSRDPAHVLSLDGNKQGALDEVAVFAAMRLLLSALDRPAVSSKVAGKYAKFISERLSNDEDETRKKTVARDFFPPLESFAADFQVSVTDYLLQAPSDLALQPVSAGKVRLSEQQVRRLVVEAVRHKVKDVNRQTGFPPLVVKIAREMYDSLPKEQVEFRKLQGKQLSQPCCVKMLQGMPEGKRFYGSMALSIAALNDELPLDQGEEVLRAYAVACGKGAHDYTENEALNVVRWAYKKGTSRFNCQRLRDQGLIDTFCSNCPNVPFSQRGK